MKKIRNQKGAISLFVLLAMLFFLTFMIGTYTFVSRRNATQEEALREVQAIYNSGASASDIYDSIISSTDTVVPVSNKEQLAKIVEIKNKTEDIQANYMINGKVYTYNKTASYVLENDIILDLKEEINGKNNIDIYDYLLYDNIDKNGHDIYYSHTDGSLWKCICYQNIGTDTVNNLFSTNDETTNYFGKSYTSKLYSILETGIDSYKKEWKNDDDTISNYEFMLIYNYDGNFDITKYNRWRQTNNPINETSQTSDGTLKNEVDGYVKITTDELGNFAGLIKSTGKAYLKTIGENENYPVALTEFTNQINGKTTTECLLFVRVK